MKFLMTSVGRMLPARLREGQIRGLVSGLSFYMSQLRAGGLDDRVRNIYEQAMEKAINENDGKYPDAVSGFKRWFYGEYRRING